MFKKGFSLIELLVVIAIIGLLAAVIMPNIYQARAKGRDAKRIADMSQLRLALEHYAEFNGYSYPESLSDLAPDFIAETPSDPQGGSYSYAAIGDSSCTAITSFHVGTSLERNHSELEADSDFDSTSGVTICGGTGFDGGDESACSVSDSGDKCYDIKR